LLSQYSIYTYRYPSTAVKNFAAEKCLILSSRFFVDHAYVTGWQVVTNDFSLHCNGLGVQYGFALYLNTTSGVPVLPGIRHALFAELVLCSD
jgi:hypothetical protein